MKRHNNSSKFINTCQNNLVKMAPLVTSQVSSSAESINTILNDFQNEIAFIPEYQRDSDQWSNEKKSLFIDSILNNITVPSFIYSSNNIDNQSFWMKSYEVVDGQQRITLLNDFKNNNFKLLSSCNVSYISENSIYYENRTYDELPKTFQNVFDNYKVSIIYLPETMTEAAKLETFRRLNQQPDTLSSQDIRLSQYAYKHITKYIRLVGVYDTTKEGSIRIIDYASSEGMHWPWANCEKSVQSAWYEWWEGRKTVKGQAPSEMFLWYIIGLYYKELNEP